MSSNFGVVVWKTQEEVEVCNIKKLVLKGASLPRPGASVRLQFKQMLGEGTIIPLHGMN